MTRLGHRLIGFGLWLATRKDRRIAFAHLDALALGRWAVERLNKQYANDEIARRHAKPSSRKRIV